MYLCKNSIKDMSPIIYLDETASTNLYLQKLIDIQSPETGTAVATFRQTDGRGQKGNVWISEPDCNISYSLYFKPEFLPAKNQFMVSQITALTVKKLLDEYAKGFSIKWPNDIYHNDQKIVGILIESQLDGSMVNHMIIGVGINVNQTNFPKQITNPVSLSQLTHTTYDLKELTEKLHHLLNQELGKMNTENGEEIQRYYLNNLYRRDGFHPFHSEAGDFIAKTRGISSQGCLILENEEGKVTEYAFKEVQYVISKPINVAEKDG
jgi:BirA family transcriptional regulator, biotin operon repressor / biotin---[acetyl-CoA-carboxylase] ligase